MNRVIRLTHDDCSSVSGSLYLALTIAIGESYTIMFSVYLSLVTIGESIGCSWGSIGGLRKSFSCGRGRDCLREGDVDGDRMCV